MKLTNIFGKRNDERAVSPVIGVILMVAITVILAAVIGAFVLNLGDSVSTSSQASIDFDLDETTDKGSLTIAHRGGDSIESDNLEVSVGGEDVTDSVFSDGNTFSSGNEVTLDFSDTEEEELSSYAGDTVTVSFVSDDSGNVLASFDIPDDAEGASE